MQLSNNDPVDVLSIFWEPDNFVVSGQGTFSPVVHPDGPGLYTLYANLENELGCSLVDSAQLTVIDTSFFFFFVSEVQCSGYTVKFNGTTDNAPFYK